MNFKETFLFNRSNERIFFRTESNYLVKSVVIVFIITFFIISLKTNLSASDGFKLIVVFFALLSAFIIGIKKDVIIDRIKKNITIESKLYFYKKKSIYKISGKESLKIKEFKHYYELQIINDCEIIQLACNKNKNDIDLWYNLIQNILIGLK